MCVYSSIQIINFDVELHIHGQFEINVKAVLICTTHRTYIISVFIASACTTYLYVEQNKNCSTAIFKSLRINTRNTERAAKIQ